MQSGRPALIETQWSRAFDIPDAIVRVLMPACARSEVPAAGAIVLLSLTYRLAPGGGIGRRARIIEQARTAVVARMSSGYVDLRLSWRYSLWLPFERARHCIAEMNTRRRSWRV